MAKTLEFWYRQHFNLAPTDQRFLDTTVEQMATEYWAHHYFNQPPGDEIEDESFDLAEVLKEMEEEEEEEDPGDWGPPI